MLEVKNLKKNFGKTKVLKKIDFKIEKGDSLYKIAKEYNINPILLSSLNGLNMDDFIYFSIFIFELFWIW